MGFLKGLGRFGLAGLLLVVGVLVGLIVGAVSHSVRNGLLVGSIIALVGWAFAAYNVVALARLHKILAVLLTLLLSVYTGVLFGILVGALGHSVSHGIVVGCLVVLGAMLIFTCVVVMAILRASRQIDPPLPPPDEFMHYDHFRDEPGAVNGSSDHNRRSSDAATIPDPVDPHRDNGMRRRITDPENRRTDRP